LEGALDHWVTTKSNSWHILCSSNYVRDLRISQNPQKGRHTYEIAKAIADTWVTVVVAELNSIPKESKLEES